MSYPGRLIEPSIIRPGLLVACLRGAADILLLSSPRGFSGVFFSPPTADNGRMSRFAAAARLLIEQERASLPDLSGALILVPHHHVGGAFLDALRAELDSPVFLAPRIATLPDLAALSQGEASTLGRVARVALLHGLLRGLGWIDAPALWPMAHTLHELIEELDAALLTPPTRPGAIEALLRMHCQRLDNQPLSREADLVHQVWKALHQGPAGPMRDYATRLANWAERHAGPIYLLGLRGLTRLEQRFLARCAENRPVIDLPLAHEHPERAELLARVWPAAHAENDDLRARAHACAARWPSSPLTGHLRLAGAVDLESEADVAACWLKQRLAAGQRRISVVALDRLVARRLRAMLERDAILMRDETGWTFSTAAASHILDGLLALVEEGFYYRDVLDVLKSRQIFSDMPDARRDAELPAFEAAVHRDSVVRSHAAMLRLAKTESLDTITAMLERLAEAIRPFGARATRRMAEWQELLLEALAGLGIVGAWEADTVGAQLLDLLRRLRQELADDRSRHDFRQWRAWLDQELDRGMFQERDIDSPIRLTHLRAARLRDFEAVAVLGADAARLPPARRGDVLSDAARLELGLPGQRQEAELARAALVDLLADTDDILITWQRQRDGEDNSPSAWLEILDALHRLAWGVSPRLDPAALPDPPRRADVAASAPPAPSLERSPARLSASAWQHLVQCPYRYFARYGLALSESDEASEEMEKRHYGELLHRILARFHERHPVLAEMARADQRAALDAISQEVFADAAVGDYLARAWLYRWQRHAEAYLDWAVRREAEGLHWTRAEAVFERELDLGGDGSITLHGRLDRLDEGPEGLALVDYKAQALQALRAKLKTPGEDVQLAFYALLTGSARAELVSLDDQRVDGVALPDASLVEAEAERLRATFGALALGAPLHAQGTPEQCARCEMRGLCRRDHWPADTASG
jgi:ATP-dependent helicase/nuclease subunit B